MIEELRGELVPMLPLTILAAGIAVLLTPLSLPLWNHTPEADFLQFPWRLLAVLSPLLALAIAAALGRFPRKYTPAVAFILAVVFVIPAYRVFRQPCDPPGPARWLQNQWRLPGLGPR